MASTHHRRFRRAGALALSVALTGLTGAALVTVLAPAAPAAVVSGAGSGSSRSSSLSSAASEASSRWIGSVVLDGNKWRASAYVQYYDWFMQSNPTYDFQINQFDRRTTLGGRYARLFDLQARAYR